MEGGTDANYSTNITLLIIEKIIIITFFSGVTFAKLPTLGFNDDGSLAVTDAVGTRD